MRCSLGLTPVKAHTPPIRPLLFLPGAHRALPLDGTHSTGALLPLDGAHCDGALLPLDGAHCAGVLLPLGAPPPRWCSSLSVMLT